MLVAGCESFVKERKLQFAAVLTELLPRMKKWIARVTSGRFLVTPTTRIKHSKQSCEVSVAHSLYGMQNDTGMFQIPVNKCD